MCGRCEKSGGLRAVCAGSRFLFGVPGLDKSLFSPPTFQPKFWGHLIHTKVVVHMCVVHEIYNEAVAVTRMFCNMFGIS